MAKHTVGQQPKRGEGPPERAPRPPRVQVRLGGPAQPEQPVDKEPEQVLQPSRPRPAPRPIPRAYGEVVAEKPARPPLIASPKWRHVVSVGLAVLVEAVIAAVFAAAILKAIG